MPEAAERILDIVDERNEDLVDLREVTLESIDLAPGARLGRSDREVEIDVSVHAEKQMLQHDRPPTLRRVERNLPGLSLRR